MNAIKDYLYAIAAIAVIAGAIYGFTALHSSWYREGYNARVAEESRAAQTAEDQAIKKATTENKADEVSQTHFASGTDQVHSVTFDIQDAIHAPEPPHPGEAAGQLVPNPFPAAFSLCWRAASTHNPGDVAACEAGRRAGVVPGPAAGAQGKHR